MHMDMHVVHIDTHILIKWDVNDIHIVIRVQLRNIFFSFLVLNYKTFIFF